MQIEKLTLQPVKALQETLKPDDATSAKDGKSFGEMLAEALQNVNDLVKDSEQKSVALAQGRIEDVSQVMIATEKASLGIQLTMQVRNKAVDAYQEVMRMQV